MLKDNSNDFDLRGSDKEVAKVRELAPTEELEVHYGKIIWEGPGRCYGAPIGFLRA